MSLTIVRAGTLTTVQDGGRPGRQSSGVSVGGAMDDSALRIANALVGNDVGAAALEITLAGAIIRFESDHLIAIAGGDLGATLGRAPVPVWRPAIARGGSVLAFEGRRSGCRAYLAVAGGIDVPRVLGGRGTDLCAGFGGLHGRPLSASDRIQAGEPAPLSARILAALGRASLAWGVAAGVRPPYSENPSVRIVPGPEYGWLSNEGRATLESAELEVTPVSNRMGYRLRGPRLTLARDDEMISSPVALGTVQLPPSGEPIVLMADRQTTGGYPRVANVVTVDVPLLAQLPPGARLTFRMATHEEARRSLAEHHRDLRRLVDGIRLSVSAR
jgi:antagonist of KipI